MLAGLRCIFQHAVLQEIYYPLPIHGQLFKFIGFKKQDFEKLTHKPETLGIKNRPVIIAVITENKQPVSGLVIYSYRLVLSYFEKQYFFLFSEGMIKSRIFAKKYFIVLIQYSETIIEIDVIYEQVFIHQSYL